MRKSDRNLLWLTAVAAALLVVIGIRFVLWPGAAARTFGVPLIPHGTELHSIIGYRDIWLGALALGLAYFREWRGLALWFGFGALVCLADAALVAGIRGRSLQLAFHLGSGVLCAGIAVAAWNRASR